MVMAFVILAAVMALAWGAYGIYHYKTYVLDEKKKPREKSERLQQVSKSLQDYARQMKEHSKKKPFEHQ